MNETMTMGMKTVSRIAAPVQMPRLKRVAAYARVSMGKDAMLHSLAAQVSYYSDLIQRNPEWEYAGVYADEGLTGTKENRPEFQRMLSDCRAGKIDMILVKSISRFARNTVTLLETVRVLKEMGISVYFEEQKIDTMSGDGELMLSILASFFQEESRNVNSSAIIWDVNCGEYTVTELTDWSWKYDCETSVVNKTIMEMSGSDIPDTNIFNFTNTYKNPDWLGGENYKENIFS